MDIPKVNQPKPEVAPPVGSIAISPNPQLGIEPAPPDRSLWLLPLVALMLLAGAVAIYFLPTNLDLLLPLCLWLSLATALLGVIAWRTIPILTSPSNKVVRHTPNGKLITWNRFASLGSLLLVTILATALATIGMLAFALGYPSFSLVSRQVAQPFVLLVTSCVVIILLLLAWLTRIRSLQKVLQLRFAGAGVLVIPVVIYLALSSWLPSLLDYPSVSTGPFASWPAMIQFARHEADRIDKDAILYDVAVHSAQPHGPYAPQTSLFSVGFMFVRPTGEGIDIEVLDTNPIRLLYVRKQTQALVSSYEYAHERYADWLASIKLGPRDVYSLTEKGVIAFARRNGMDAAEFRPGMDTSLLFSDNWSSRYGVPALWNMYYMSDTFSPSMDLYVDGATGRVLDRHFLPSESSATPTPHPPATASPTP